MKAEIGLMQWNCDQVCKEKQNIGTDSQCLLIDNTSKYTSWCSCAAITCMYVCKYDLEIALAYYVLIGNR
jgi:hypothetical protein